MIMYNVFGDLIKPEYETTFNYVSRPTNFKTNNMQRKAAMFSSNRQDWQTPLWFYNELKQQRNIHNYDTDPATNDNNPLDCKLFYTVKQDGLMQPWKGNVFINPPFGWGYYKNEWTYITGLWIKEAWYRCFSDMFSNQKISMITMIIPSSVSTKVFHKYLWNYDEARARPGIRVNFYPKRIKFGGSKMVAPFNTMIVDFIRELGSCYK